MEQVRWRRARPALAQELRTHLLDQRDACLAQGMSQTEAEAESLRQMGDPVEVFLRGYTLSLRLEDAAKVEVELA